MVEADSFNNSITIIGKRGDVAQVQDLIQTMKAGEGAVQAVPRVQGLILADEDRPHAIGVAEPGHQISRVEPALAVRPQDQRARRCLRTSSSPARTPSRRASGRARGCARRRAYVN